MRDRKPIELYLEIVNDDREKKAVLQVSAGRELGFDKSCLKTIEQKRFEPLKAREAKRFYFDVFPRQYANAGDAEITVKVDEYLPGGELVGKSYSKNISVTISD
jgi:hypothetical protein